MNVQLWMHNRSRGIKSYPPLLLNASPCRNKMMFWDKICCLWMQEFSQMHTFQVAFCDFWQECSFLTLLMVGKRQGLFFISEKGQSAFLTSKKGQGAMLTFKKGRVYFWLLNKGQGVATTEKCKTWTLTLIFKVYFNILSCMHKVTIYI